MDKEDMVYRWTMEYYSVIKKNEILPFATTWVSNLEDIMLSEISQRNKNTVWFHFYVESKTKQNKLIDAENRLVVIGGEGGWGVDDMGEGDQLSGEGW